MIAKKKNPVYKKPWDKLTPRQMSFRERSLDVLSKSRKSSQSLSKIAKSFGLSVKTVLNNTNAFKKINRKWIPKKYDKISRVMKTNENGNETSVDVNDSRNASKIGRYQNSVKQFLETGNISHLVKFQNKGIRDAKGDFHLFETNPESIMQINQRTEEPEFYEIYGDGN